MAAAGLASLMATWWSSPIDRVNTIPFTVFPERDIAPLGYAAFAFTLGAGAGLLIRRTLPAMAVTLAAFIAARVAVTELRPHFQPPVTVRQKLPGNVDPGTLGPGTGTPPHPGDWVLSSNTLTVTGRPYNPARLKCPVSVPLGPNPGAAAARAAAKTCSAHAQAYVAQLREVITYQPAGRYWPFQACETAIFLALAGVLAGACFWWIRRRIT